MTQISLNFSRELTNAGIKKAVDSARKIDNEWDKKAFDYLVAFVRTRRRNETFMIEDVRQDAGTIVPVPFSNRSWGYIARMAIQKGIIKRVGIGQVKNATAHRCNASIYIRNI